MKPNNELFSAEQQTRFFSVFALIRQITLQKLNSQEFADGEDISQEVKLGLMIWKRNRPDQDHETEEWLKMANRTTQNKIKEFRRRQIKPTVSLSELDENELCHLTQKQKTTTQLEGNTTMELHLLMSRMWDVIKTQTFFENCALLLKNDELSTHLIFYRGCQINEMAERLKLTQTELDEIIKQLPLSDLKISEFLSERFELKATPAAIRKARQRATDELQIAVNGKEKKKREHGNPSGHGQT